MPAVLCGCNPIMLEWGLFKKPGLGIKPQEEILGGDGVSVLKESVLVFSSEAGALPDDESEEEDKEVTSAKGEVCTFGGSTARSASMRKFLDFSIWPAVPVDRRSRTVVS
ncbi:hypothetical protein AAFF_G00006340 [Aldrovandia affinis]|uniref:Uncharacterized protein n=1 Tax=Aldrovandia affinis TaxID=143900 RepID=A0AAD7TDS1_9TELE|nr:hypothetical protein AAFF_G00006340 [Aldrovandia affinis]